MKVELKAVLLEEKEILNNLLEKYNYEFSQYDHIPFDNQGLFHYHYLDNYWTDNDRYAYFIIVDSDLAGFVLINKHPECDRPIDWAIAEFFVAYTYRRNGIATAVMDQIFNQYQGYWHIKYHPQNIASDIFWNKVVTKASNGNYEIVKGNENYYDGTESNVLFFKKA